MVQPPLMELVGIQAVSETLVLPPLMTRDKGYGTRQMKLLRLPGKKDRRPGRPQSTENSYESSEYRDTRETFRTAQESEPRTTSDSGGSRRSACGCWSQRKDINEATNGSLVI